MISLSNDPSRSLSLSHSPPLSLTFQLQPSPLLLLQGIQPQKASEFLLPSVGSPCFSNLRLLHCPVLLISRSWALARATPPNLKQPLLPTISYCGARRDLTVILLAAFCCAARKRDLTSAQKTKHKKKYTNNNSIPPLSLSNQPHLKSLISRFLPQTLHHVRGITPFVTWNQPSAFLLHRHVHSSTCSRHTTHLLLTP